MISLARVSRFRAAAVHLGVSALIAAAVALMLALWYPPPLFGAMSGKELVILIVGVDVVIGPLLTLIIFDPRKKELLFDLSVILALQLSALAYGMYAMHAGRPAFVVFVDGRFSVVAAASIEDSALAEAREEFRSLPQSGPRLVAVDLPDDPAARTDLLFAGFSGLGAQNLPRYYVPYTERRADVLAAARPLERLLAFGSSEGIEIDSTLKRLGRRADQVRYLPVATERTTLTALVDASTGDLLAMVAVKPAASDRPSAS